MIKRSEGNITHEWHGDEIRILGKKVISSSIYAIGLAVEGQAKLLCPVDTGRLRGSITTQSREQGTETETPAIGIDKIQKPSGDWVIVGTAINYGPYMEYGTQFTDAQPFLRPSLALAQGQALTITKYHGKLHFKEFIRETP